LSLVGGPVWGIRARAGTALAALLVAGVLLLTQSRSAWVAQIVVLVVVALFRFDRVARRAVLLALLILGAAALIRYRSVVDLVDRSIGSTDTGGTRLELWRGALEVVRDHPIAGVGLNTFPFVLHALYGAPDVHNPHAHNIYLQAAVDLGLPGALALLLLV